MLNDSTSVGPFETGMHLAAEPRRRKLLPPKLDWGKHGTEQMRYTPPQHEVAMLDGYFLPMQLFILKHA